MNTPPIGPEELTNIAASVRLSGGRKNDRRNTRSGQIERCSRAVLVAQPESGSFVKYASVVAYIPTQTMADDNVGNAEQKIENLGGRRVKKLGFVGEESLVVCKQREIV
uniref:Uncharacterized protein n=2 Tax=Nicotiana TaxID=4085 RepID=A0A1S4CM94_TOBAC|nr:PREDICTED: uncharacterized protein LOC104235363 [Nicotiana sylvestris]XP_016502166.1 PREDICTED: uncharacterized protein LOC107820398 [Nicotiana tabacum]